MNFFEAWNLDTQWILDHFSVLVLTGVVLIEWIALQALLIHYHFFRESLKRPTPDGIRLQTIEKVLSFQAGQMDRIYGKLSELNKEISDATERTERSERRVAAAEKPAFQAHAQSEASFVSLGELNLKKRLNELENLVAETPRTKVPKIN